MLVTYPKCCERHMIIRDTGIREGFDKPAPRGDFESQYIDATIRFIVLFSLAAHGCLPG